MAEITTASGLIYEDTVTGAGAEAKAGDHVVVHYTGWLTNGSKFDSSKDRNDPFDFPLGQRHVISGWDEGVQGMKIGGTRKLTKFTVAPTWSPAGQDFWARPEIRLYYTYASWNEAAQRAASLQAAGSALSDSGAFDNARHGSNFGVQVEYWWK